RIPLPRLTDPGARPAGPLGVPSLVAAGVGDLVAGTAAGDGEGDEAPGVVQLGAQRRLRGADLLPVDPLLRHAQGDVGGVGVHVYILGGDGVVRPGLECSGQVEAGRRHDLDTNQPAALSDVDVARQIDRPAGLPRLAVE